MEVERRNEFIENCKRKCACSNPKCPNRKRLQEEEEFGEQRTFVSFICETISVIAFIIFGSIVFWFAVGGVLFDFFKRLYYCDRYLKILMGIAASILLISMSIQCIINSRADEKDVAHSNTSAFVKDTKPSVTTEKDKAQETQQKEPEKIIVKTPAAATSPLAPPLPQPPPPEYMKISLKDKHLENLNGETPVKDISKKMFILTITDDQKKEVFRIAKTVFVPELEMEKSRPTLVVALKDILLEDY